MKVKKLAEMSGREELRKFHGSRSNSSDTDNVHDIGDHLNITGHSPQPKRGKLAIGNWEVKHTSINKIDTMKVKKSAETGGREQLSKFHEARSNFSDTKNVHTIGDHLNTAGHIPKPKHGKKRTLAIGNWEVKSTKSTSNYSREANSSLINTAKFAIEKKISKQVQVDTFKFLNQPISVTKSPSNTKKMVVMVKVSPPVLKKQHSKGKNEKLPEPSKSQKNEQPSDSKPRKPWLQYSHNAQNALSVLNKEVSSALCEVLGNIDNIQMRVRVTIDEIKECERLYEHLRHHKLSASIACHSSPSIQGVSEPLRTGHNDDVGLIQTQSENQMRIAILPDNTEIKFEDTINDPKAPSITETQVTLSTNSKKMLYNIPPQLELSDSDDESTIEMKSKWYSSDCKNLVVSHKTELLDVNDKLPRKCAHANLHKCLLKEFGTNDSLLEFEKRIKPKYDKKKSNSQRKVVEIVAEELYVPEKINKISSTIIHSGSSNKKFLYQETRNKCKKKSLISTKYQDSLFFAQTGKISDFKLAKSGSNQCNVIVETVGQPNYSLKQECRPLRHSTGLDYFDILDEITLGDIKPLKSEYPRRDIIDQQVANTYLYKLVHDSMQDQFLQLLRFEEPTVTCSQQCDKCKSRGKLEKVEDEDVGKKKVRPILPEIILPKKVSAEKPKKKSPNEIVSKLRQYIFDPHIRYPTTITVMPVVITTYTNPNFVNAATQKAAVEKHSGGDFTAPSTNKKYQKPTKSQEKPKKWNTKQSASPRHGESWGDFEGTPKRATNCKQSTETKMVSFKQTRGPVMNKLKKPNRKWETNIQSLIELVERKIVDILSNPQKTHFEAFKSVEAKILELLNSQKSLETIEENLQSAKKTKFLSNTTSTLDKMKKNRKELVSKTYPTLVNSTRSLPMHVIRFNLKAPTLKRNTIDESTLTTKSILVANLKNEQTSCTFSQVSGSLEVINFLDTLANISNDEFGDVHLRKIRFYKLPIQLSYPFSLPTQFYPVTIHHSLSLKKSNGLNPPTSSSSSNSQRNSSLPVRRYKILATKKSSKTVTFKTNKKNKDNGEVPKASEDYVEGITVNQFDYTDILSYFYAALFTVEFLGLAFHYSCE